MKRRSYPPKETTSTNRDGQDEFLLPRSEVHRTKNHHHRERLRRVLYLSSLVFAVLMVFYKCLSAMNTKPKQVTGNMRTPKTFDFSPRMVQLEPSSDAASTIGNATRTQPSLGCVPMHKWQLPSFGPSSCNIMHEVMYEEMEFINCGGSRCAFRIQEQYGTTVVLKTPMMYDEHYDPEYVKAGWKDTIAMERLSASPFVLNMFANCGVAQITELGQSSLHDLIKLKRLKGRDDMSSADKLRIGFHLASGVADVHSIDGNVPSFAHNDLDPGQVILVDGIYKISDFHIGSIKYKDDSSGNVCTEIPVDFVSWMDKMRAPEELFFKFDGYPHNYIHRDKVDVWCLGNMLYNLLTNKWVFEDFTRMEALTAIIRGKQSSDAFANVDKTDPSNKALINAIQMAWTFDPDARPTSRRIASFLRDHLDRLKSNVSSWRVSIPPLPPNYRYSESDFRSAFDD